MSLEIVQTLQQHQYPRISLTSKALDTPPRADHFQAWKETSPGRWERPLTGGEASFARIDAITAQKLDGREHFSICTTVKVKADRSVNMEKSLRRAWKQIRYEQPDVACMPDINKFTKVYEVPTAATLKQWLDETFFVMDTDLTATEMYPHFKPCKNASLYWFPRTSEIVFRASHYKIDGVGGILFWDALFSCISNPVEDFFWGSETGRLAPTMEAIWDLSEHTTYEKASTAYQDFMDWAGNIPAQGPVSKMGKVIPGRCNRIDSTLSKEQTSAFVAACKRRGCSVTAAIHAAFIAANTKHADPNGCQDKYVSQASFGFRKYLPKQYAGKEHCINVYCTPYTYTCPLPMAIDDSVKDLDNYYKTAFTSQEKRSLHGHYGRALNEVCSGEKFMRSDPFPRDPVLSSLGVAEQYVSHEYMNGKLELQDFRFSVDVVYGLPSFFMYTFDGQLRFTYCYNDNYQERSDVQAFLDTMPEIMQKEIIEKS